MDILKVVEYLCQKSHQFKSALNGKNVCAVKKKAVCRFQSGASKRKISQALFFYWRARLKQNPKRDHFKELVDESCKSGVCIERAGFQILIEKGFDPATLSQCLQLMSKGF